MGATGMLILVLLLLVVGISPASYGRERMGATVMLILVSKLLVVGISLASNGRERTGATGTNLHTWVLNVATTQMF